MFAFNPPQVLVDFVAGVGPVFVVDAGRGRDTGCANRAGTERQTVGPDRPADRTEAPRLSSDPDGRRPGRVHGSRDRDQRRDPDRRRVPVHAGRGAFRASRRGRRPYRDQRTPPVNDPDHDCYRLLFTTSVQVSDLGLGAEIPAHPGLTTLGYLFTVVALIGLINAFNLIDGLDGLASGLAVIALAGIG